MVDVTGTSKGKGYQGVMKRHNMRGMRASHGVHEYYRHGGSIGCRLTPGRVHKGKRMAGQMGNEKVTMADLVVVRVLEDENVVLVKGSIPGPKNGVVTIKGSVKDVVNHIVPQEVKEVEARNPMKASRRAESNPLRGPRTAMGSRLKNKEKRHDRFFKQARAEGYSARAVFKLEDVDKRIGLLRRGDRVLDPGVCTGVLDAIRRQADRPPDRSGPPGRH